jgi:hypothetical protein
MRAIGTFRTVSRVWVLGNPMGNYQSTSPTNLLRGCCYLSLVITANFYRDWGQKLLIQNWACLENGYGGDTSGSIREHRAAAGALQLLGRGTI